MAKGVTVDVGSRRWAFGRIVLGMLCTLSPLTAAAQPETGAARGAVAVTTQVDACLPIDRVQFERVLSIELGTSIEYSADGTSRGGPTQVELHCVPGGVEIRLDDSVTQKSMQRVVNLSQAAPSSRSRLLALMVAEFVVASWVELRVSERPSVPAASPAPVARPQPAAVQAAADAVARRLPNTPMPVSTEPPSTTSRAPGSGEGADARWQLGATFSVLTFTSLKRPFFGGALHLGELMAEHIALAAALEIAHAEATVTWNNGVRLGDVRLTTSALRPSVAYLGRIDDVELSVGLAGRLGVLHMAGRTDRPNVRSKGGYVPWGGLGLLFELAYCVGAHLRLFVQGEVGYVTLPAQALIESDDMAKVVTELASVWFQGSAGLGYRF